MVPRAIDPTSVFDLHHLDFWFIRALPLYHRHDEGFHSCLCRGAGRYGDRDLGLYLRT